MRIQARSTRHTLLIDTREKTPLVFFHPGISTRRATLTCGDYGIRFYNGQCSAVVFERKNIGDLFGTLTAGYKRFRNEITRAKVNNIILVLLIEGSLTKVARGYKRSRVHPQQVIKTVFSLWVRYGIVPVFAKDRSEAAEIILQFYLAEFRKMEV